MPVRNDLRYDYQDYLTFPDDGRRHEIIEGERYVSPAPSANHQYVVSQLSFHLQLFLHRSGGGGYVFTAPIDVILSPHDVVQPDLVFVRGGRRRIITRRGIEGPPDLIVEVLSPSTRRVDEMTKRKTYGRFGIGEYWIVDPELERVKTCANAGGGFGPGREFARDAGDALASPLLPGFALPLATLFAERF